MDSQEDRTASLMTPAKLAKVAASASATVAPGQFLDRMASDVGHQHLQRLGELRHDLRAHGEGELDQAAQAAAVLERMRDAMPQIDFAPLQERNWWADLTGKSRSTGSAFAATFDKVDEVARQMGSAIAALQKRQLQRATTQDRTLVEFNVEYQALDKVIHQGSRWLQDMRNQIKARQEEAGEAGAGPQALADEARCDLLVERLKRLRAAAAASQQVYEEVLATMQRRSEFAQAAARVATVHLQAWRSSLSAVASAAPNGKVSAPLLDEALKIHDKLRRKLEALLAEAGQLGTHETALVTQLGEMGEQLAAAA
ncbi:toxic anion resistance protein [Ramlibacter sp. MMS24-I3-19]|uniref:toxic anion resistance protein n=1 Tax=Ramlibacter sp. MMS24-I3-19 TaxID=3416606 RepID=UPI003D07F9C9